MINVRTDLAIESRDFYKEQNKSNIDGVIVTEEDIEGTIVTTVEITDEDGANKMGKPIGTYISSINLPAPGRRHTVYVHFRVCTVLCF